MGTITNITRVITPPDLGRLLQCPICREDYTNPRMLPCIHSFCHSCLAAYIDKSKDGKYMLCPMCKAQCSVPEDGASGFIQNCFLSNIQETASTSYCTGDNPVCSVPGCEENVTTYCYDGCEFLCKNCLRVHNAIVESSKHQTISAQNKLLKRNEPDWKSQKNVFCEKHPGERVSLYCRDCCICGCSTCFLADHGEHDICELSEQVEASISELRSIICQVEYHISEVERRVNSTIKEKNKSEADMERVKIHVITVIDNLHRRLEQQKKDFIKKMTEATERNVEIIAGIQYGQSVDMTTLTNFSSYAKLLIARGSQFDINNQIASTRRHYAELKKKTIASYKWNLTSSRKTIARYDVGNVYLKEDIITVPAINEQCTPVVAHVGVRDGSRPIRGIEVYDDCVWLVQSTIQNLSVHSLQGELLQTIKVETLCDPQDLTKFSNGPFVISDWDLKDKRCIFWLHIEKEGEKWEIIHQRKRTLNYAPLGLSVTPTDKLLVSAPHSHSLYLYNKYGQQLEHIQLNRNIRPYKALSDPVTHGFIVINPPFIVWMHKDGKLIKQYQPKCGVEPQDISFDEKDKLYILGYNTPYIECICLVDRQQSRLVELASTITNARRLGFSRSAQSQYMYIGHKSMEKYEMLLVSMGDNPVAHFAVETTHLNLKVSI